MIRERLLVAFVGAVLLLMVAAVFVEAARAALVLLLLVLVAASVGRSFARIPGWLLFVLLGSGAGRG